MTESTLDLALRLQAARGGDPDEQEAFHDVALELSDRVIAFYAGEPRDSNDFVADPPGRRRNHNIPQDSYRDLIASAPNAPWTVAAVAGRFGVNEHTARRNLDALVIRRRLEREDPRYRLPLDNNHSLSAREGRYNDTVRYRLPANPT